METDEYVPIEDIYADLEPRIEELSRRDERLVKFMSDEEEDMFYHIFASEKQYLDAFNDLYGAELKEVIAMTKGGAVVPAYVFSDPRFPGAYTGEALLKSLELDKLVEIQ